MVGWFLFDRTIARSLVSDMRLCVEWFVSKGLDIQIPGRLFFPPAGNWHPVCERECKSGVVKGCEVAVGKRGILY